MMMMMLISVVRFCKRLPDYSQFVGKSGCIATQPEMYAKAMQNRRPRRHKTDKELPTALLPPLGLQACMHPHNLVTLAPQQTASYAFALHKQTCDGSK
jgi:hypothetical protein